MSAVPAPSRTRIRWIGFQTIVLREMGRILRIWGQTIVPSAVTAALYFVIFGSLISSSIRFSHQKEFNARPLQVS